MGEGNFGRRRTMRPRPHRGWGGVILACLLALPSACALNQKMTVVSTAGLVQDVAAAASKQPDLQVVREGMPAYLLLMDGMVEGWPDNDRLLLAAAQAYSVLCRGRRAGRGEPLRGRAREPRQGLCPAGACRPRPARPRHLALRRLRGRRGAHVAGRPALCVLGRLLLGRLGRSQPQLHRSDCRLAAGRGAHAPGARPGRNLPLRRSASLHGHLVRVAAPGGRRQPRTGRGATFVVPWKSARGSS